VASASGQFALQGVISLVQQMLQHAGVTLSLNTKGLPLLTQQQQQLLGLLWGLQGKFGNHQALAKLVTGLLLLGWLALSPLVKIWESTG
jgi:hypothetical protein